MIGNYKYIHINKDDIEILILDENDNSNLLYSFIKDYPTVRGVVTDKYYFWSAMITHYDMAKLLNIKEDEFERFIIEDGYLSNEYLQLIYDEIEKNNITDIDIQEATRLKNTYDRLKVKFGLTYRDLEDEKIMNDIVDLKRTLAF